MSHQEFLQRLHSFYGNDPCPFREKAWKLLNEMGLPEKKWEAFQYLPLDSFYLNPFQASQNDEISKQAIQSLLDPSSQGSTLIFVNGTFRKDLSFTNALPEKVILLPIAEAMKSYGAFLDKRHAEQIKLEKNPFVLVNHSLYTEGLFLYVPPKVKLEDPIHILFITTNDTCPILMNPKVEIFVGRDAELNLISSHHSLNECAFWTNQVFDVTLEEGAIFSHFEYLDLLPSTYAFQTTRAALKRDSRYHSFSFSSGSEISRQDARITLKGENSEADIKGISLLDTKKQSHIYALVEHAAPHTRSYQHFKHILKDQARSSFEGKIFVESEAQKTDAYQMNHNLLLSEKTVATSKPNLEIFADDVKASHGATMSQLRSEELFYLQSRGLKKEEAKQQLIKGYCLELTKDLVYPSFKGKISKKIDDYIIHGNFDE